MDGDTIIWIVWGVVLAGILVFFYFAYRRRRLRTKRQLMTDLLKQYFHGGMPARQFGEHARQVSSRHFLRGAEFYSLVIGAFQGAVDAELGQGAYSKEQERRLLGLLAALKTEFGLTDRYQIEAWRPGRE